MTTAIFLERPVARLSAALDGTKSTSLAIRVTFSRVAKDTEPLPERAREAVDFDTPAFLATSASVLTSSAYRRGPSGFGYRAMSLGEEPA